MVLNECRSAGLKLSVTCAWVRRATRLIAAASRNCRRVPLSLQTALQEAAGGTSYRAPCSSATIYAQELAGIFGAAGGAGACSRSWASSPDGIAVGNCWRRRARRPLAVGALAGSWCFDDGGGGVTAKSARESSRRAVGENLDGFASHELSLLTLNWQGRRGAPC